MTIGELVELLLAFDDPDLRVVTGGFDEAYLDDVSTVELKTVKFDLRPGGLHCGPHEERPDGIPAIVIDF